jgi:hypothetical protein
METSMIGGEADWIELKCDPGIPSKLVAWRQKLSDKAKQENLPVNGQRQLHFPSLKGCLHPVLSSVDGDGP